MFSFDYWVFQPEVWLILALVLIIADILIGLNLFILPIGVAAAVVAAMIFAEQQHWFADVVLLESWREVLIAFGVLSVASVFLIRKLFQDKKSLETDINEY